MAAFTSSLVGVIFSPDYRRPKIRGGGGIQMEKNRNFLVFMSEDYIVHCLI